MAADVLPPLGLPPVFVARVPRGGRGLTLPSPWTQFVPDWPLATAALATAVACATLSPLVVARRWGFVGEGVSHSGFGGAGVVWLASAFWPATWAGAAWLSTPTAVTVGVGVFAVLAALSIGRLTRGRRLGYLGFDAATGIVMTASLAFGFLARDIYAGRTGLQPVQASTLLFGNVGVMRPEEAVLASAVAVAVVGLIVMFRNPVLAWTTDAEGAAVHGVGAARVHYGLLVLLALVVVVGSKLTGVVLVTALLILPGATAAAVADRLGRLWAWSLAWAASATVGAVLVRQATGWPTGPVLVLWLALQFVAVATGRRFLTRRGSRGD